MDIFTATSLILAMGKSSGRMDVPWVVVFLPIYLRASLALAAWIAQVFFGPLEKRK